MLKLKLFLLGLGVYEMSGSLPEVPEGCRIVCSEEARERMRMDELKREERERMRMDELKREEIVRRAKERAKR
jgi:hypothetical protein